MPGFRSLPESLHGVAADYARDAAALEERGDQAGAVALYELALKASLAEHPQLPGYVCGRLAAVYRREARYQDELDLLEQYRDSQTDEVARSRFDARISKARALAEKHTRTDSAALASVRAIKKSPRRSGRTTVRPDAEVGTTFDS